MADFSIQEILTATGGRLITGENTGSCSGISSDTRTIKPGEAFLALKGERFDGHEHVTEAVKNGASFIIDMHSQGYPGGVPVVQVDDTLRALGDIARFHRRRFTMPVIGITGSNGKTTTKEMTAAVLSGAWPVVKTEKNFNNEIGLPITLLRLTQQDRACVVEMGMRGRGQIAALCKIALPTVGLITNVGVTHMELLGSQQAIADAKAELAEALPAEGKLVLNADDPYVTAMKARTRATCYRFSLNQTADLFLENSNAEGNGQHMEVNGCWGRFSLYLPALGRHNLYNALASTLTGLILGLSPDQIAQGLRSLVLADQRLVLRETNDGIKVLDDTYNSSPPAVEAALETMDGIPSTGKRIAVLGDMLELGNAAEKAHTQVGEGLKSHSIDVLFGFGTLSQQTVQAATKEGISSHHYHETNMEELINDLNALVRPGDFVIVKGSRGMHMERVVQALLRRNQS
ncbi:MAG TPA: UDP-N-acetylmuramoyl-tripeptide--D-alanyl-D-alanine ligase [Bacillota bacterium]|nr:UDP-N-acetylmuramoyl-tripeptide--D-alanyl-D-alanine ligase [Bacillota bacterium]